MTRKPRLRQKKGRTAPKRKLRPFDELFRKVFAKDRITGILVR